jgi:hypothetical protein
LVFLVLNRLLLYRSYSTYDAEHPLFTANPIILSSLGLYKTDQCRTSCWAVYQNCQYCGPSLRNTSLNHIILLHSIRTGSGKTRELSRAQGSIKAADCLAVNVKLAGCELLDSLVHYSEAPVAVSSSLAKHRHTQLSCCTPLPLNLESLLPLLWVWIWGNIHNCYRESLRIVVCKIVVFLERLRFLGYYVVWFNLGWSPTICTKFLFIYI